MMAARIPTALAAVLVGAISPPGCERPAGAQSRLPLRDTQTITRTLQFDGSTDRTVDVRAINGAIRVTAADISDVLVEARRTVRARTDADADAAARNVEIEFLDDGSRVGVVVRDRGAVCGEPSFGRNRSWRDQYDVAVEFAVRVPRRTNLRLCTINGGEVVVEGTDGEFEVNNVNGGIILREIRGAGSAETINGAVAVSFVDPPRAASRFKTLNGDVDATFPSTLSADLLLKTRTGGLFTDFDAELLPQRPLRTERADGMFVYRSDGSARVRVGRGGPELTLETFNGDVRLRERR
jgi:DUF4097 and DUF4098 domain-containing protein YvlB